MNNSSNESKLNMFKCGLSSDANKHMVIKPVQMSCGHSICKDCLLLVEQNVELVSQDKLNPIKCNICSEVNSCDLKQQINNTEALINIKNLLEKNFNQFINEIRSQFNISLNNLKGLYANPFIESRFRF